MQFWLKSYMEAHMVMLTYGYYFDIFWVAHYTMDMALNLYNGYGI
jgi:hypothetical protein